MVEGRKVDWASTVWSSLSMQRLARGKCHSRDPEAHHDRVMMAKAAPERSTDKKMLQLPVASRKSLQRIDAAGQIERLLSHPA